MLNTKTKLRFFNFIKKLRSSNHHLKVQNSRLRDELIERDTTIETLRKHLKQEQKWRKLAEKRASDSATRANKLFNEVNHG